MPKLPKDARIFLADAGYGLFPCIYSPAEDCYVLAVPQVDMYQGKRDMYWEGECIKDTEIERWTEINEPS